MSKFDEMMQGIDKETEVPEQMKRNLKVTLEQLPEEGAVHKVSHAKQFLFKVAMLAFVVIVGSTTIYAGVKKWGIAQHWKKTWNRDMSQEELSLVETDVEQSETNMQAESVTEYKFDDFVNAKITETLCDSGQCIVEVVLTPEKENYVIMGHGEEEETESKSGKQILYANAWISDSTELEGSVTASCGVTTAEDGSCHYVLAYDYPMNGEKKEFLCHLDVWGESTEHEWVSKEIEFAMSDKSNATTYVFLPEEVTEVEDSNVMIDQVVVVKTELGIKCTTYYHLAEEVPQDEKINFSTYMWMLDENGERLEGNPGGATGGSSKLTEISTKEKSISWTDYYVDMEIQDVLLVQPHDISAEIIYEPVKVYLKKTK
ncbi:MAG: hypothetical protein E7289_05080 [Lachnospiraceae bacterium]|nr:hypothetical protein [Lachnospiraceae bacterium]